MHRRSGGDSRDKIPGPGKRTTSNHSLGPKTEMGLIRPHVRRPGGQVSRRRTHRDRRTAARDQGPPRRNAAQGLPHVIPSAPRHTGVTVVIPIPQVRKRRDVKPPAQGLRSGRQGASGFGATRPLPPGRVPVAPPGQLPHSLGERRRNKSLPKISSGITRGLSQANLVTESLLGEIFSSNTFPLQIHPASNAYILPSKVNL